MVCFVFDSYYDFDSCYDFDSFGASACYDFDSEKFEKICDVDGVGDV